MELLRTVPFTVHPVLHWQMDENRLWHLRCADSECVCLRGRERAVGLQRVNVHLLDFTSRGRHHQHLEQTQDQNSLVNETWSACYCSVTRMWWKYVSLYYSEEQCTSIKKWIGEGKTEKELHKVVGSSNGNQKLKDVKENGKLAFEWTEEQSKWANDQHQEDQRRSKVTCEYCYK